jgi:cell division protein FtsN/nucleoid DNA-binding protein
MKTVAEYIRTLLYEYDYVTVPNFGAFIANYQPSSHNEISGSLMPPQKKIAFNELLKQDDGLLAMQIARREGIRLDESKRRIHQYVEEVKDNLAFQRFFTFERIGTFSLNEENKLVFEPDRRNNFFSESFGFDSLFPKQNEREKYNYQNDSATEAVSPVVQTKSFGYMLYALPVLLLSAGLFYVLFSNKPVRNTAFSSVFPTEFIPKIERKTEIVRPKIEKPVIVEPSKTESKPVVEVPATPKPELKILENKTIEPVKVEQPKAIEPEKKEVIVPTSTITTTEFRYQVVAGLFKNAENAKNLQAKFIANGLNSKIEKVNNFSRVIAAELATSTEANQVAEKIKTISGDKGIVKKIK